MKRAKCALAAAIALNPVFSSPVLADNTGLGFSFLSTVGNWSITSDSNSCGATGKVEPPDGSLFSFVRAAEGWRLRYIGSVHGGLEIGQAYDFQIWVPEGENLMTLLGDYYAHSAIRFQYVTDDQVSTLLAGDSIFLENLGLLPTGDDAREAIRRVEECFAALPSQSG